MLWSIASHQDTAPICFILQGLSCMKIALQGVPYMGGYEHTGLKYKKGTISVLLDYNTTSFLWEAHLDDPLNSMSYKYSEQTSPTVP